MSSKTNFSYGLLLLLSSCGQREEVGHYPTGEVEYRAPLDEQGVFNGEVISFYKNGKIRNILPYQAHHINGLVRRYYANGTLKSTEFYKKGSYFGKINEYYLNGKIKYQATLRGSIHVDTARFYHPNGELKEVAVYDSKGRKVDYGVWDAYGKIDTTYTRPLFLSDTDTLYEGQDYSFEITLANRRSKFVIVKIIQPLFGIDSAKGIYTKRRYILRRPQLGAHQVKAKLYQKWLGGGDTLWTNWYQIAHAFYVKKQSR